MKLPIASIPLFVLSAEASSSIGAVGWSDNTIKNPTNAPIIFRWNFNSPVTSPSSASITSYAETSSTQSSYGEFSTSSTASSMLGGDNGQGDGDDIRVNQVEMSQETGEEEGGEVVLIPVNQPCQKCQPSTVDLEIRRDETAVPTESPTKDATTGSPTKLPTAIPTTAPTSAPTNEPTASPTRSPTSEPTNEPTKSPTRSPTTSPSASPVTAAVCSLWYCRDLISRCSVC